MSNRSRSEAGSREAGSRMEPTEFDFDPELNDEQWELIADLFANPDPSPEGGRPKADARACF